MARAPSGKGDQAGLPCTEFARALVDVVRPVIGRCVEKPVRERVEVVRHQVRADRRSFKESFARTGEIELLDKYGNKHLRTRYFSDLVRGRYMGYGNL